MDQAAANLKTSELWTATGNVRSIVWQNGQGTNHPDGFPVDEQMPVLWARDPATGATNALYVNVPNHPDQFDGESRASSRPTCRATSAKCSTTRSAAPASSLRARSDARNPRARSPTTARSSGRDSIYVNAIQLALAQAQPLTSGELASTESSMSTTADNAGLIGLMQANAAYGPICGPALGNKCTIPRAPSPRPGS